MQEFGGFSLRDDFKWFRTIHSACCGLLGVNITEIIGRADLKLFSSETGWNVKGTPDYGEEAEDTHDVIINAMSIASNRMIPVRDVIDTLPDNPMLASTERFIEDYNGFKHRVGKIDYIDMLESAVGRGRLPVKAILVDECQDLSDLQWKLVHQFADGCDYLYLAGDDDQAIFEFIGSSHDGFLKHECDRQEILKKSYRCPAEIGEYATRVIKKVGVRESKQISWRTSEGSIERLNIDLSCLPWKDIAGGDKSYMILMRHQKQIFDFCVFLIDNNIPHSVSGKSHMVGRDYIKTYLDMKHNGAAYSVVEIGKMMRKAGDTASAHAARRTGKKTLTMKDCEGFNWDSSDWPRQFSKNEFERKILNNIRRMVNIHGIGIIGVQPRIDVSTYHTSKGREADIIILNTDCYTRTWNEQMINPDPETRLCYVGITRAKEKVIIINPKTNMYMRPLVEIT